MNVTCPLCNTPMLYKHLENKLIKENQTDFWACPTCPSILLKYYNENDIKTVGKELKKLKPLIF